MPFNQTVIQADSKWIFWTGTSKYLYIQNTTQNQKELIK